MPTSSGYTTKGEYTILEDELKKCPDCGDVLDSFDELVEHRVQEHGKPLSEQIQEAHEEVQEE
jgi:hypothetical protein